MLNDLSNIFTLLGVCFAVVVYLLWTRDYTLQRSDECALALLKKVKRLHLNIDSI